MKNLERLLIFQIILACFLFSTSNAVATEISYYDDFSTDTTENYEVYFWERPDKGSGAESYGVQYNATEKRAVLSATGGYGKIFMKTKDDSLISPNQNFSFSVDFETLQEFATGIYLGDLSNYWEDSTYIHLRIECYMGQLIQFKICINGNSLPGKGTLVADGSQGNLRIERFNGLYSFYFNDELLWEEYFEELEGTALHYGVMNDITSGSAGWTAKSAFDNWNLDLEPIVDYDGDGISDEWEYFYFGDLVTSDGTADYDNDSLSDLEEYENGTNPTISDVDTVAPSVSILTPVNRTTISQFTMIRGSASDVFSEISKVELLITDGTSYITEIDGLLQWTYQESWVMADGLDTWTLDTNNIPWTPDSFYDIKVRATDAAGNTSPISSITIAYAPGEPAYTTLALELSTQTIFNNGSIDAFGKLTRLPDIELLYLSNLTINLTVGAPDGSVSTYQVITYDEYGHYKFENFHVFSQEGLYDIQTSFESTALLYETQSPVMTVLVGASAGYAVIVQGKIENGEGIVSHNKSTNRIYARLKDRGFLDDNIRYYNYNEGQDGVDATPSKSGIQGAIQDWAAAKMNGSPAPLWIIMVDHGNTDAFYLVNETITPSDLDSWLNNLEGNLNENALDENRIVIIGACYSGSFIPDLSGSNRVIVTSAAEDEPSYKGPMEPDGIRSGEFFMEEFFQELKRGRSLKDSFIEATDKTEIFTRRGGGSTNINHYPYFDDAVQHPLLQDDSDSVGSNILYDGEGDGYVSRDIFLGVGVTYDVNSAENPAEILEVTESLFLDASASSAQMWARTNDPSQVITVWMEIRSPSTILSPGTSTNQLKLDITPNLFMELNTDSSRWEKTYDSFIESGKYEIYYYAKDVETGNISPMERSVVYKAKANNKPPRSFNLLEPDNGDEVRTVLPLVWNTSIDPDGDPVTYTVKISEDPDFASIKHRVEGITQNYCFMGAEAELADLTPAYYWHVIAIDTYGAERYSSETRSFHTDNTNGILGFLVGIVVNKFGQVIGGANVETLEASTTTCDSGLYTLSLQSGTYDVSVTAPGYFPEIERVEVVAQKEVNQTFVMRFQADSDDDGLPDDVEAILGTKPDDPDTDNDGIQDGTELGYTLDDIGPDTDTNIFQPDLDPSTITNPLRADTDEDGMSDGEEDANHNGRVDEGESDPNPSSHPSKAMPWLLLLLGED